ncbi:MAG: PTS glucose transporter subunit IIA [Oscillospiraceae bacterium]|nr:PTS glucose transporter subunit IIA [Oscillospiraceae bacterium]
MGLFDKLFGKKEEINPNHVYAPLAGETVAISEVPDPTFSSGAMGNGIAIKPTDGKVCSPVNGTVDMMFDTGHAVTLVSDNGIEILIHVGLETVGLEGKPFQVKVQNGQKVKKGDILMIADLAAIEAAGLPTITPVLICNTDDYTTFNVSTGKAVTNADVVIELGK